MANLITIGRLLLVFIVIALVYEGGVTTITFCIPVVALIFAADGLDGYVARKRKSTSQFGSIFDIAGDRIVENALWIAFANLGLITVAAPLLVMTPWFRRRWHPLRLLLRGQNRVRRREHDAV